MNPSSVLLCSMLLLTLGVAPTRADDLPSVESATKSGLAIVNRAGVNWKKNKTCFSCHHQTLPMFAIDEVAKLGVLPDSTLLKHQDKITSEFFNDRLEALNKGEYLPGGSFTAVYGLWAFKLANHPTDEATTALVNYLLKKQRRDGAWAGSCVRPPLQSSEVEATVLALVGMQHYATATQVTAMIEARTRAEQWLAKAPLKTAEDRIWRLWGLYLMEWEEAEMKGPRETVLAAQNKDGGWSHAEGLQSDAFSTGQALFILRSTGSPQDHPAIQRATEYLLRTQCRDGSWLLETRVRPVQIYFDNGDPHGKHQFISVSATAWATAALAQMLPVK